MELTRSVQWEGESSLVAASKPVVSWSELTRLVRWDCGLKTPESWRT